MQAATVLFLAANPLGVQALQLGEECRAIEDKIRTTKFRDQIRFRSRWTARPDDLMQALNDDAPSVLHFSGHGAGDQGLCFQADDGQALRVSTDSLTRVMQAAGNTVSIVVLNACFSEAQAKALVALVPCVVGMSGAIGDEAAITYAGAFYRALASGRSVANAHDQGTAALTLPSSHEPDQGSHQAREVGLPDSARQAPSPRLLTRPGTDADDIFLVGAPTKKRCVLVIKAVLRDFDGPTLARITDELRKLTGDLSVQITDVEEGSVRLTISLSPTAARMLVWLRASGQLSRIGGFEVSDLIERAEETSTGRRHARGRSLPTNFLGGGTAHADDVNVPYHLQASPDTAPTFAELARTHQPMLQRFALRLTRSPEAAKDLVQETLVLALTRFDSVKPGTNPAAWLTKILANLWNDHLKHQRVESPRALPELSEIMSYAALRTFTDAELYAAINSLEPDLREVVDLLYFKNVRSRDAAAKLGVPIGTVSTRLLRARARLRELLNKSSSSDEK